MNAVVRGTIGPSEARFLDAGTGDPGDSPSLGALPARADPDRLGGSGFIPARNSLEQNFGIRRPTAIQPSESSLIDPKLPLDLTKTGHLYILMAAVGAMIYPLE